MTNIDTRNSQGLGVPQDQSKDRVFLKDVHVQGLLFRSSDRYYLEEFFEQTPGINGDLASVTEATRVPRNRNFEVLGTNATSALVTFSATEGAITLTTAGADNDQIIIAPHLDTAQSAWANVKWGTENEVVWETLIRTASSIATALIWAGLKLTNTETIATDDDQVFFRYSTDDSNTTWRCISSIGGTDTNTDSGVTVAVSTTYRLKIAIDSARKATFYINDVVVHKTAALTNDVDLIPYVAIQSLSAAADSISMAYEKISRKPFE